MDYVIHTTDLSRHFGSHVALRDVDLRVPRGPSSGFSDPTGPGRARRFGSCSVSSNQPCRRCWGRWGFNRLRTVGRGASPRGCASASHSRWPCWPTRSCLSSTSPYDRNDSWPPHKAITKLSGTEAAVARYDLWAPLGRIETRIRSDVIYSGSTHRGRAPRSLGVAPGGTVRNRVGLTATCRIRSGSGR